MRETKETRETVETSGDTYKYKSGHGDMERLKRLGRLWRPVEMRTNPKVDMETWRD